MTYKGPMISCICVTKNRPIQLRRSIKCFKLQTYRHKELVIVYEEGDHTTEEIIRQEMSASIKPVKIDREPKLNLGALRNLGVQKAGGVLICQWDDDDWYHIGRLELQQAFIENSGKGGCILTKWIIYDEEENKAYISMTRLWEGSIMCEKNLFIEHKYANKKKGEDADTIMRLFINNHLFLIEDFPNIYVYSIHGQNTWNRSHFNYFLKRSQQLDEECTNHIRKSFARKRQVKNDSYCLDEKLNLNIFT